jgi:hypothetical protein
MAFRAASAARENRPRARKAEAQSVQAPAVPSRRASASARTASSAVILTGRNRWPSKGSLKYSVTKKASAPMGPKKTMIQSQ